MSVDTFPGGQSGLVLSLFPGIDILGRGFEATGFCVVRGPDKIFGGDIRGFHPPAGRFEGVIGGPPCQDFSRARRAAPTGYGREMVDEFCRVVAQAAPTWWLMENVGGVPSVAVPGYQVQKFNLNASECGGRQRRLRVFFFGSNDGSALVIERGRPAADLAAACMATEGNRTSRRGWAEFCILQGLPAIDLPGWSISARYRAVGNAVPFYMAQVVARAVRARTFLKLSRLCLCGCGRKLRGRQKMATAGCRKRMQRRRRDVSIASEGAQVTA